MVVVLVVLVVEPHFGGKAGSSRVWPNDAITMPTHGMDTFRIDHDKSDRVRGKQTHTPFLFKGSS